MFIYKVFDTQGFELYTFHSNYQIKVGDLVCKAELTDKMMGQQVKHIAIIANEVTTSSYHIYLYV